MTRLKDDGGALDVLCANAGIAGPTAKIEEIELEAWRRRCVAVNLVGSAMEVAEISRSILPERSSRSVPF